MQLCTIGAGLMALSTLAFGCTRDCPCAKSPSSASSSNEVPVGKLPTNGTGAGALVPAANGAATGAGSGELSPPPGVPPSGAGSLPEVTVRNVGLHVGGGVKDESEREPFKRAIEARFEDFLRCYRAVEQPDKGGTFGVDLFISRGGGQPEVRQPRTAIKGAEFRECMVAAFSNVSFDRPKAGPTVISYSLKFELSSGS